MIDPRLAAELPHLSDHTLGLFIRAGELALQAYEMLVPEGSTAMELVDKCRITLATAIAERERRAAAVRQR
jgi:hypothetical protein